jgi:parallel beta-helix repeat protein
VQKGFICDDNSINVSVIGNTVAHTQHSGIYLHNARKCTITDNRCYNNAQQLAFQHDHVGSFTIDSNIVKRNEFFAATAGQLITSMQKSSDFTESFASWATFDNNKYCAPLRNEANIIYTNWFSHGGASEVYYNLGTWKTFSGQDASTTLTPQTVTDPAILFLM